MCIRDSGASASMCLLALACAVPASTLACFHARASARLRSVAAARARPCARVRARVRPCARACVRACVRARVRARVCARVCDRACQLRSVDRRF
eukprot:12837047-Alexandrium_andersonii.AAC.1